MGIEPTTFGPEPIVLPLNYHPLIRQGRTDWNLPRRVVGRNPRIVQDALGPRVTVHLCLRRSMLMEMRHRIEGHTVRANRRVRYEVGGIVMQQHGLFCCTLAQAGGLVCQRQSLHQTLPNPTGEGSGHAGRNCWHDWLLAEFV